MMRGRRERGRLAGAMTAIVTPFDESGEVDHAALVRIVAWQIEHGIEGLVPCGTTGEGVTLDEDEKAAVVASVVEAAAGRVPVIAGCGTNSTRTTVEAARRAREAGADALLVVTPPYNKPNRSGMIAHYEAVASESGLPIVVYNVPSRTAQNLGAELILRLAEIPGVVAVKEATKDLEQVAAIVEGRPEHLAILSGDDALALPAIALGAYGLISVIGNEAPAATARLVAAARRGALDTARDLQYRLAPLMRANFLETNPVPVKAAMHRLGLCRPDVRPPLGPAAPGTLLAVEAALDHAGLLEREP